MKAIIQPVAVFLAFIAWSGSIGSALVEYDLHEVKGLPADYSFSAALVCVAFVLSVIALVTDKRV